MRTIVFKKDKGEIVDKGNLYHQFDNVLETIKNGAHEISFNKPKRNVDQNALMWMWFNCLSQDTGMEPQDLYKHYSELFLFPHCTYNSAGKFKSGGTSILKTNEFADFLTKIQADAAIEFHNQLPTRDDLNFADFQNQYEQSWQGQ
jgi:hypothetical protein